jgi:hypothetical protein
VYRLTKPGARSAVVLAAAIAGLACAAPGLAAKAKREAVTVGVSEYWEITVDGHAHQVKAGGEIIYHSCNTVEDITPVLGVTIRGGSQPAGNPEYEYRAVLVGPKSAGTSEALEGAFFHGHASLKPHFTPVEFDKLSEIVGKPQFPPGSYNLQLTINGVAVKLLDTVGLRSKAGC